VRRFESEEEKTDGGGRGLRTGQAVQGGEGVSPPYRAAD
jgi:hypothetical protein